MFSLGLRGMKVLVEFFWVFVWGGGRFRRVFRILEGWVRFSFLSFWVIRFELFDCFFFLNKIFGNLCYYEIN